jgi:hypothetical protein
LLTVGAFVFTGAGPNATVIACVLMDARRPAPKHGRLLDFKPVLANREALGYILGYGAHCFELYGIRIWLVGFWTFVIGHQGAPAWLSPVTVSFVFAILSMPASILGNEAALKFGRHRAITIVMIASAAVTLLLGSNVSAPAWALALLLLAYGLTVPADSGALTPGMSAAATSDHRGATMALLPRPASGFRPPARGERAWRSISPAARKARADGCWFSSYSPSGFPWDRSSSYGLALLNETQARSLDSAHKTRECTWIAADLVSSFRLAQPGRSLGDRATICRPSWPIRSPAISGFRATGSSRRSRDRW